MLDLQDLASRISVLSPEKQRKVLWSYRYENLSTLNKLRFQLSRLPADERKSVLEGLPPKAVLALVREWKYRARPDQQPPKGHWKIWINCAGRGTGKSQSGLHWIAQEATDRPGEYYVVGKTKDETMNKQVRPLMALLADMGHDLSLRGATDKRGGTVRLQNGSVIYSDADTTVAENVRGYNLSGAWIDELCVYREPEEAFKQIEYAVRRGRARIYVSTTPLVSGLANKLLRELIRRPLTHYSSTNAYANLENLAVGYIISLLADEGKRRAEEEIWAEILDNAGTMFRESMFYDDADFQFHFTDPPPLETFEKLVIAYDPAGKSGAEADEHGVVVVGSRKMMHQVSGRLLNNYWVLADHSEKYTPNEAAKLLSRLFHQYQADAVVAEVNNGWDWISTVIANEDRTVHVKQVTATRGKTIRAEPVVGVYEQQRVRHHIKLGKLEGELTSFVPDMRKSPNRADALVWAISYMEGVKAQQWQPMGTYLGW